MQRRTYVGSVVAAAVSLGDWIPGLGSDDEQTTDAITQESDPVFADSPASQIQSHPLQHGTDVDTATAAHHPRPSAGAYLAEASDAFDVQVTKETDTWAMPAASDGTHTFSTANNYDLAHVETFLPVSGSLLNDLRAVPRTWRTQDGLVTGVEVAWTNGSTSEESARVEVLGFKK